MRLTLRTPIWDRRKLFHTSAATWGNVLRELEGRGFVAAVTSPKLAHQLEKRTCIYSGVDPSARSLHVGNLLPLLTLLHMKQAGHHVLALIGGATGSIGDPSGRSTERNALDKEVVEENVRSITAQVQRFFHRGTEYAQARSGGNRKEDAVAEEGKLDVVNNHTWTVGVSLLDFLRDVGKFAKVNTMLSRESVKNRLASEQGISFTEFSYQLLQAFDFRHLYERYGCRVQVGGSDQWGNIVSGIDLIKRSPSVVPPVGTGEEGKEGKEEPAFGLTIPLLTTSTGEKFGKSAGNAVWLDPQMTSVFDFYQYFLRTPDADVGKLLRLFTFLPLGKIEAILAEHETKPHLRAAQKLLASEITQLVHGRQGLEKAHTATAILYGTSFNDLEAESVLHALQGDDRLVLVDKSAVIGKPFARLASSYGLAKSNSEASRSIKGGGFYVNNNKLTDTSRTLQDSDLLDGRLVVLAIGKGERKILYLT
ncbi:tyrosyl-tRNA synthetase [Naganishia albida]|nr:tyrosyl-tRNA synthetase [Naganishia albida]